MPRLYCASLWSPTVKNQAMKAAKRLKWAVVAADFGTEA